MVWEELKKEAVVRVTKAPDWRLQDDQLREENLLLVYQVDANSFCCRYDEYKKLVRRVNISTVKTIEIVVR